MSNQRKQNQDLKIKANLEINPSEMHRLVNEISEGATHKASIIRVRGII